MTAPAATIFLVVSIEGNDPKVVSEVTDELREDVDNSAVDIFRLNPAGHFERLVVSGDPEDGWDDDEWHRV